MSDKVVKFPVTYSQRKRKEMGPGYVPCEVSGRWLQFPKESAGHFGAGEFISVDVMTYGSKDEPKKICNLIVTRENLLRAINSVKCPADK